jgi:hypothetical protein
MKFFLKKYNLIFKKFNNSKSFKINYFLLVIFFNLTWFSFIILVETNN